MRRRLHQMLLRGVNARQSLEWAATLDAQLQAELVKRRRPLDPTRGSPGNVSVIGLTMCVWVCVCCYCCCLY